MKQDLMEQKSGARTRKGRQGKDGVVFYNKVYDAGVPGNEELLAELD